MNRFLLPRRTLLVFLLTGGMGLAGAATLSQQIEPSEVNVGDPVSVTFTVQNGSEPVIQLPRVEGLQIAGSSTSTNIVFSNGSLSSALSQAFTLIPLRAGDFIIPAFDIHLRDGQVLHARAMKLHVDAPGAAPAPAPAQNPSAPPNGTGPVVSPPESSGSSGDNADNGIKAPLDSDGQPAKAFMVITPKTTDAYVGETIPLRIEFFLRMDSIAQQDSLPTIKGSDFLMNDLSVRPAEDVLAVQNEPYHRETWLTAISAPRNGDFPLQMERATYWVKGGQNVFTDPLGNFFARRSNLVHVNVLSNPLTVHVHSLPAEGKPADFSGAIGQFKATGSAAPATVSVDDPVYLDFSVTGEGNFNSVRAPVLAPDPAWKSYAPSSQLHFVDETRTEGNKTFHQAIIPKRGGAPLPAASFSYFDPTSKKYVTIPISLPAVTVTGTAAPETPAAVPAESTATAAAASVSPDLTPNRLELGSLRADLTPFYRRAWFWISQGGLLLLVLGAAIGFYLRSRRRPDLTAPKRCCGGARSRRPRRR